MENQNKFDVANPIPTVNEMLDQTELQYHYAKLTTKTPEYDYTPTPITDDPIDDSYETDYNYKSTETQKLLSDDTHQTKRFIDDDDKYVQYELNDQGERIYSLSINDSITKQGERIYSSLIIEQLGRDNKEYIERKIKELGRDNKEYIEQLYDPIHSEINNTKEKHLSLQQRLNNMQPKFYMIAICFVAVFVMILCNFYQQNVPYNNVMQMNIEMNNRLNNIEQIFKQNESVTLNGINEINHKIASVFDAINTNEDISVLIQQSGALFSIILIMIVIGVFALNKIRFEYHNGSLVNNDFANDEFLNAQCLKPNHAMKTINDDNCSCSDHKQLLEGSGSKLVYSINNDITCNDYNSDDECISPDFDDIDGILSSYDNNYDSFEIEISEMDEDYDSAPSLLYTPNFKAKTVQGSESGSQSNNSNNTQNSQQTSNSQSTNDNNATQHTATRDHFHLTGNRNGGDGNDPNRKHNIKLTCGNEFISKKTKKEPPNNKNKNDNQTPITKMYKSKSAPTPTTTAQTKAKSLNATATPWLPNCYSIWVAPTLDSITETPETPETPFDNAYDISPTIVDTADTMNLHNISNCTDDPIELERTEKKGEKSPKLSYYKTKRNKTKGFKTKGYKTPNNWSYVPDNSIRGQGNVFMSKATKEDIIPQKIKETVQNMHQHVDGLIAITNNSKIFPTKDGRIKIFNVNFHDKITNRTVYCIAKPYTKRQFKWEINKVMTADEINHEFPMIFENDLPPFNMLQLNEKHQNTIKKFISNKGKKARKRLKKMIEKAQWQNSDLIRVFGKHQHRKRFKFKRDLILSFSRTEFIKQIDAYIENNDLNNIHLKPIVMFKNKQNSIHYVWNIQIDCENKSTSIGISFQCINNNVIITGIHCDKNCLLEQHQLILPESDEHKCNCFDDFQSNISYLQVYANPDNIFWRDKYTNIKTAVRKFTDNGKNNFVYDMFCDFCQEIKQL